MTPRGAKPPGDAVAAENAALEGERPSRTRRRVRYLVLGFVIVLIVGSPYWGPLLMRRMAFFRVRRVEIVGAHYVAPNEILSRLRVDTTVSVWDPFGPLERRVAAHPGLDSVRVERKLPGTLVITVHERQPVALVPAANGFVAYDDRGAALPLDPSRTPVDAPIAATRDTDIIRTLAALRSRAPDVYAQVSEVRRTGADELLFDVGAVPVRTMQNVSADRLTDIDPVVRDLTRRHLRPAELDLRYRDQVIARIQ